MKRISVQRDHLAIDLSYHIRTMWSWSGSEYNVSEKQLGADMLQLYEEMLKPEAHAHVLVSSSQFSFWTEDLCTWRRVDSALSNEMSTGPAEMRVYESL